MRAMESATLHEWTVIEFKAICRKHNPPVRGKKGDLFQCVKAHF